MRCAYAGAVPTVHHFIDGSFCDSRSGARLPIDDPASGEVVGELCDGGADEVEAAVAAAERAFLGWSRSAPSQRARVLRRLADLIERDTEALARAESIDSGKPVALARSVEIPRAAANFRFFADLIGAGRPEVYGIDTRATNTVLRRSPGVAACISPWNLPLYLFTWKIAPALAAGCTVVGKPSEVTPVTAHMLCQLAQEAGLPAGVLNVVHGRAGAALVEHERVARISFTGGTATGRSIATAAARNLTPVSLELGGKNATIILEDAPSNAVEQSVRAAFQNQGQICLCGSRVLVHRSIYERFVGEFVERAKSLRSGDPLHETTEQGALVSAAHCAKVLAAVQRARDEGGTILCGGARPEGLPNRCSRGHFVAPTVVTGLDSRCSTNQEEIFGPMVSILPFDDETDAIAIANGVRYGLAASVWTKDESRGRRIASQLDVGTAWINCWMLRDLRVPFGGWKHSGIGREGGEDALRFFTEPTVVCQASTVLP